MIKNKGYIKKIKAEEEEGERRRRGGRRWSLEEVRHTEHWGTCRKKKKRRTIRTSFY